jgi:dCTP deaminase
MTMLSDRDIRLAMTPAKMPPNLRHREPLIIVPAPTNDCFQPASIDLKLGNEWIGWTHCDPAPRNPETGEIRFSTAGPEKYEKVADYMILNPGQFMLGTTIEYVEIPRWLAGQVDGKSTLGRQGILVHVTAGFIDPGFKGRITLEFKNIGPHRVALKAGMKICQLVLHELSSPALRPYGTDGLGSKYQFQKFVTDAR